jgi:hypothetical protein
MADTIETTAAQAAAPEAAPSLEAEVAAAQSAAEANAGTEAGAQTPVGYLGLSLPEGYRSDDPVFADAVKLFDAEQIAPETAQRLIDFTIERDKEIARAVSDHSSATWMKQTTEWRAISEKEFSPEALGEARAALSRVFDRQTIDYLEGLGFTNHPGLIRGMVKVARSIKDDSFVGGNAGRGNGALDPKSLYPNSQHN